MTQCLCAGLDANPTHLALGEAKVTVNDFDEMQGIFVVVRDGLNVEGDNRARVVEDAQLPNHTNKLALSTNCRQAERTWGEGRLRCRSRIAVVARPVQAIVKGQRAVVRPIV
eukprot:scaffold283107_cov40-Tisochrysis_lutea.AAC.3